MLWISLPIGLVFVVLGIVIRRAPAETLLKYDVRTAKAIYRRAPDPQSGLERAQRFYRAFGAAIAALGVVCGLTGAALAAFFGQ